jgi:hypothetical protein
MSEVKQLDCLLAQPGHSLPDSLRLTKFQIRKLSEEVKYLGRNIVEIGICDCYSKPSNALDETLPKFNFVDLPPQDKEEFPYKQNAQGCTHLYAFHDPESVVEAAKGQLYEILLGYPNSRLLFDKNARKYFWLKANDGSLHPESPAFWWTERLDRNCTGPYYFQDRFRVGPALLACLSDSGVRHLEGK